MMEEEARHLAAAYTAAWNSRRPEAVARHFSENGGIVINNGEPWRGRDGVARMAAGFFAEIPDLALTCDGVRAAGHHLVYLWTFTGTHAGTGNAIRISGWEEWDLDGEGLIARSFGWFDSTDYAQQCCQPRA